MRSFLMTLTLLAIGCVLLAGCSGSAITDAVFGPGVAPGAPQGGVPFGQPQGGGGAATPGGGVPFGGQTNIAIPLQTFLGPC